ncbi:MAG: hypothetical protein D9V47_05535 [Clostridia bacterium]|nr:MAG: hypothetical protein D9V47_05535 [Clostridia bacterium]
MEKLNTDAGSLIKYFQEYWRARLALLERLGCPHSNRDPLAEFSERLVASLLGGRLAESRVEKGYDVLRPDSGRVQVKYLANPDGTWVNGHTVRFTRIWKLTLWFSSWACSLPWY